MSNGPADPLLEHIRHLASAERDDPCPDRDLLRRFTAGRDEAAFAALVRRHGPLVLRVCRRVLGNVQDAEDVFQATFLVLARKAASVRSHASLASWLHGVAYRTALRARSVRRREAGPAPDRGATADPADEVTWRELRAVLDEALSRLPERYRAPLILCYLEGLSRDEAAQRLGCPLGTLKGRLERGRELLRARLARRGLDLSVALLGAGLAAGAVSPALARSAARAALLWNTAAGGSASPTVASLAGFTLRAMTMSQLKTAAVFVLAAVTGGAGLGLAAHGGLPGVPSPAAQAEAPKPDGLFQDVTAGSGVVFTYRNGEEANHYAPLEAVGGGVALLDYDGDGLLDLFVTGGGHFDGPGRKRIAGHPNKLFKNLGGWKFKEVTREAGLGGPRFYTHGAAVADYDNDGRPDLLVTGWGRLALYRNEGGRFAEVTQKAGLTDTRWSTSAAWADFDGDGFADLYVCRYVDWSFDNHPECQPDGKARDVCPPKQFRGLPHSVYRNDGKGGFEDVSAGAGLRKGGADSHGLGVVAADLDDDGRPDLYVTNDTTDNFLYLNRGNGLTFAEVGLQSGTARDDRGVPNGSSGADAADYDGSGRPSLWVANSEHELPALYRNLGRGMFLHASHAAGVGAAGTGRVGFGSTFADLDNDGHVDLVTAAGHVLRHAPGGRKQRPLLLRNEGGAKFADVSGDGGPYFRDGHVGRGLAVGDLDNDGWPDLIVSHLNEPVVLLRNAAADTAGKGHLWLGLELSGEKGRDVVGAKIVVEVGGRKRTHFARGGGSYLSSGDRRVLIGLGTTTKVDRVTVIWPSGAAQSWAGELFEAGNYWLLVEKKGRPERRR